MKNTLAAFLLFVLLAGALAAPPVAPIRTIKDLPHFPRESLRSGISRPMYRSIEVSPIEAWVVARTALYSSKAANAKIVHSEANGVYDRMLLDLAGGYTVSGTNQIEGRLEADTLNVHLLIFKIKDGLLAICFAHCDDARYVGYQQRGNAWVGIMQNGKWKTISKPDPR